MVDIFKYKPFDHDVVSLGLKKMKHTENWIDVDDRYDEYIVEKQDLFENKHDEVYRSSDNLITHKNVDPKIAEQKIKFEVLENILRDLGTYYPDKFKNQISTRTFDIKNKPTDETFHFSTFSGRYFKNGKVIDNLEVAARLVQEDLVLIQIQDGEPVIVAGAVCFPSGWSIEDKIGKKMELVHDPVPGYKKISNSVDEFLRKLDFSGIYWRTNWSICDTPFLHIGERSDRPINSVEDNLWFRLERQTFRKMPESGCILFGIKIFVEPMSVFKNLPDESLELYKILYDMPNSLIEYKGLSHWRSDILRYLLFDCAEKDFEYPLA